MEGIIYPLFSFVFWSLLFFVVCRVFPHRDYHWNFETVVLLHALVALVMSSLSAFYLGPAIFFSGVENTDFEQFIIANTLGYFFFDQMLITYFKRNDFIIVTAHHVIVILFFAGSYLCRSWGTAIVLAMFVTELTGPLRSLRYFLRRTNNNSTPFGRIVDCLFVGLFCFNRVVICSVVIYYFFQFYTDTFGRMCVLSFHILNLVMSPHVCKHVLKGYGRTIL